MSLAVETDIAILPSYEKLLRSCLSQDERKQCGYKTEPMSEAQIIQQLRCEICAKPISFNTTSGAFGEEDECSEEEQAEAGTDRHIRRSKTKKFKDCIYHPGFVKAGQFSCCGTRTFVRGDRGCTKAPSHVAPANWMKFLNREFQLYNSPSIPAAYDGNGMIDEKRVKSQVTYKLVSNLKLDFRKVVALDCEFGVNKYDQVELIRLSLVDFFTCEVLVDSLVYPDITLKHCNTKYSGITKAQMESARRAGQCIRGKAAARKLVGNYISDETIVVVHGGTGDLHSLRLIHPLIIDTCLLDKRFQQVRMFNVEGGSSLKNLCARRLAISIQKGAHDSVEDALSARNLLVWMMKHLPELECAEQDPAQKLEDLRQTGKPGNKKVGSVTADVRGLSIGPSMVSC